MLDWLTMSVRYFNLLKIREQLYNWSDNEVKNKSVLLYTLMVKVFLSVVGIARKWGIVNTMTFYSLQNYIVCNYRLYYLTLKTMVKTLLNIYILLIWIYIYFIEKIKYSKKFRLKNCFSWVLLASFILGNPRLPSKPTLPVVLPHHPKNIHVQTDSWVPVTYG